MSIGINILVSNYYICLAPFGMSVMEEEIFLFFIFLCVIVISLILLK